MEAKLKRNSLFQVLLHAWFAQLHDNLLYYWLCRATILHYDQAEKQCQTIEKCVTLNQLSTISEPATQSPSVELVFGPSANKIKAVSCE